MPFTSRLIAVIQIVRGRLSVASMLTRAHLVAALRSVREHLVAVLPWRNAREESVLEPVAVSQTAESGQRERHEENQREASVHDPVHQENVVRRVEPEPRDDNSEHREDAREQTGRDLRSVAPADED